MKRYILLSIPLCLILIPLPARAQESKPRESKLDLNQKSTLDMSQRYQLLAVQRTATLQKELSQAVAAGYRLLAAWSGGEMLALLEAAPPAPREYRLLAAARLATLERELNDAADQGFRLLPTAVLRNVRVWNKQGEEIVLLLERTPGATQRYAYRLAAASSEYEFVPGTSDVLMGALQKEPLQEQLRLLVREGYDVVGLVSRSVDVKRRRALGLITERARRVQHILIGERTPERHPLTPAEEAQPAWRARYRLIANKAGPELQQELSQAAGAGYRLLLASPDASPELVLVMEKTADPADSYDYLVLGEGDLGWLQNQMKGAVARGFRPHRRAIFREPLVVIMERGPGAQLEHDYSVLETTGTATLEKELVESAAKGYVVVGASTGGPWHLAIMEKSVGPLAASASSATPVADLPRRTLTLGARKSSSMQKQLNEAAAQGYHIMAASAFTDLLSDKLSFTLEKIAEAPATYEYRVLSTTRVSTMQKELNQAAAQGFRLVPSAVLVKTTMFRADELLAVVEKAPGALASYKYLVLSTKRVSTLEKEIEQARAQRYEVIGRLERAGDHVAFLERPVLK